MRTRQDACTTTTTPRATRVARSLSVARTQDMLRGYWFFCLRFFILFRCGGICEIVGILVGLIVYYPCGCIDQPNGAAFYERSVQISCVRSNQLAHNSFVPFCGCVRFGDAILLDVAGTSST